MTEQTPPPTASAALSRRTVIRASAWATPVVLLSTAAPARAASLLTRAEPVVAPIALNAGSWSPGRISIFWGAIGYAYERWNLPGDEIEQGPATATVTYRLETLRADDGVAVASVDFGPVGIPRWGQTTVPADAVPLLPAGRYILRVTVLTAELSDSSLPYDFRSPVPQTLDSSIVTVS